MLNRIEEIANTVASACHAIRENCSLHEAADALGVQVNEDDLSDKDNLLHLIDRSKTQMDRAVGAMKSCRGNVSPTVLDLGRLEGFRGL